MPTPNSTNSIDPGPFAFEPSPDCRYLFALQLDLPVLHSPATPTMLSKRFGKIVQCLRSQRWFALSEDRHRFTTAMSRFPPEHNTSNGT